MICPDFTPEDRMARIMDTLSLYRARRLSCVEAVELLGTCKRHFRHLRYAHEA